MILYAFAGSGGRVVGPSDVDVRYGCGDANPVNVGDHRTRETAGFKIYSEPTAAWWAQRPLWLLVPGVLLTPLVAAFTRVETRPR